MDEQDDDLELEIVDLDAVLDSEVVNTEKAATSDTPYRVYNAYNVARIVPALPVKQALNVPRFTPRQRRLQLLATVGVVVLLLLILVGSYNPTRTRLVRSLVPPTPSATATRGPSSNLFYFSASPAWGHLLIDGEQSESFLFKLTRGRHVLRWLVEPFVPQQCTISVPSNTATDTCRLNAFVHVLGSIVSAGVFSLPVSLAQLSRARFEMLVSTVQTVLDMQAPSETVLTNEMYAVNVGQQAIQRAKEPLRATLRYQLDSENTLDGVCSTLLEPSTPCTFNGQECYLFCTFFPMAPSAQCSSTSWNVLAAVQATWEYKTARGGLVTQNQPELLGTSTIYDHLLPLCISWDGTQWSVAIQSSHILSTLPPDQQQLDVACNTALNTIRQVLVPLSSEQSRSGIAWQYVPGASAATGCLSIATLNQGQGSLSPPVAYCLHRFGVMLAANDIAHRYWPKLPVADAYEQQLAAQLAKMYQRPQDNP